MNKEITPVEKSLCLSYLYSKLLLKNLDVAVHELKVIGDPRFGKMLFYLEKLKGSANKAYQGLEKNIGSNMGALEADIEALMDEHWGNY